MRILSFSLFIAGLGYLPIYTFSTFVEPELNSIKNNYSNYENVANEIAESKNINSTKLYSDLKSR